MSRRTRSLVLVGLVVAVLLGGVASFYASSQPDGLEKVAGDQGFLDAAQEHDLAESPVADYAVSSVDDDRLAVGAAGVVGVLATFAIGVGLFVVLQRVGARRSEDPPPATA